MLNTDIEVFYDLELDPDEFVATCGPPFQNCNLAPTYDIANDFARVGKIAVAPLIFAIATTIANSDSGSDYRFSEK